VTKEDSVNVEDRSKLVLKVACSLLLVVMPIFEFVLWKVPNPEGPDHASIKLVLFMNFIAIGSWVFALYYCLYKLGWIEKLKGNDK